MMNSEQMTLLTGNRLTSDDGMVAWLVMRLSGLAFQHRIEPQARPDMPVLIVDGERIVNSLGIAGFVGELTPAIWPEDSRARAHGRSMAADAFGNLHDFKSCLPMAITEQFMPVARMLKRSARDLAYFSERWRRFLEQNHSDGPFLFGEFSAVDAFNAPLAARCVTYGLEVDSVCEAYVDAIMSYPMVAEWQALAGNADESARSYRGESLSGIHGDVDTVATSAEPAKPEPEPINVAQPTLTDQPVEPVTPPYQAPDDELPFKVDVAASADKGIEKAEPAPTMVRPQPQNRLFQRGGKRLFQPNYRPISTENDLVGADEALAERPVKVAGIKPIGGEIRRRR